MKVVTLRSIVGVIRARRGYKKFLIDFINQCEIVDAISIPAGATNGDMIKAMTGLEFSIGNENRDLMISNEWYFLAFDINWWNAPYRLEGRE